MFALPITDFTRLCFGFIEREEALSADVFKASSETIVSCYLVEPSVSSVVINPLGDCFFTPESSVKKKFCDFSPSFLRFLAELSS
jgi:hypothetical protein